MLSVSFLYCIIPWFLLDRSQTRCLRWRGLATGHHCGFSNHLSTALGRASQFCPQLRWKNGDSNGCVPGVTTLFLVSLLQDLQVLMIKKEHQELTVNRVKSVTPAVFRQALQSGSLRTAKASHDVTSHGSPSTTVELNKAPLNVPPKYCSFQL